MPVTWPTIGGENVIGITGTIVRATRRSEMLLRPGLDGVTVRRGELRGRPFPIQAIVDATAANLQTKLATFRGLSGTKITIVERIDGANKTHTDIWVQSLTLEHRPVALSAGGVEVGLGVHRIVLRMQCVALAAT